MSISVTIRSPPRPTLFPYTTLFRSADEGPYAEIFVQPAAGDAGTALGAALQLAYQHGEPLQPRSEEHTSELQSHSEIVCRLLLEKKNEHSTVRLPSVRVYVCASSSR